MIDFLSFFNILINFFNSRDLQIERGLEQILFNNDTFNADTVTAKHDEQYMPREVADKLKEQGVWQGEATK